MSADDEQLVLWLCMKAAGIMEDTLSIIRPPFDCQEDALNAVEALERRSSAIAKLAAAAMVVYEN
ncbi:MAG: hypothetical protein KA482_01090 [Sphingobium sp.]|nr:hypothetical protein [Sphingobium sp.]MBP9156510.1 hypothetical protein [Sphingobium sp.]